MSRRLLITLILVLVLPLVSSCGDDSDDTIVRPDPDAYRALTLRDNVLYNLEKAWEERNLQCCDDLLDDAFVFHFSVADVKNGSVSVPQWDRAAEMAAVGNMFDPDFIKPGQAPVSEIFLRLWYEEGEDKWEEVVPDQEQFPGETWYSKVFRYSLTVQTGDFTYIGNNLQASVIVRQTEGSGGFWRIVSWSDDTENLMNGLNGAPALFEGRTWTWGSVKDLYAR